jgi:hypothetical protein
MASRYRHRRDLHSVTDPLRHLLNRLAGTTGAPSDSLHREGLEQARRFGWVYEFQGRVALTGAGAYHAGEISGGMLGGSRLGG